ncbi:MAG: acylphosphatase [Myxococcaceae bacterium]|jgi:acylphosphatase|nr:acylphosphatase [Myxococcaceae bacterium]
MSTCAVHLRISGLVQGVSYRASAQDEARRLALVGWVRNCSDGSVEALVVGAREAVEAFVAWSRRGPSEAHVTGVEREEVEVEPAVAGFSVRR